MKKAGFTTSIPVEILFSAGITPVDLNNIFISSQKPDSYLELAEKDGFPRNTCSWIKGMYSCALKNKDIDVVIGVMEGDCSNTRALIEVMNMKGIKSVSFAYNLERDYNILKKEIQKLCSFFNVNLDSCVRAKGELDKVRKKLVYLDELTWKHNRATGFENHIWQVSSSDFCGDYRAFDNKLKQKIAEIEKRKEIDTKFRLGYIGVPPIFSDLYDFLEQVNARVVFNEVQRQFTMFNGIDNDDIVETYRNYTYPHGIEIRIKDIKNEIKRRNIQGIIHYVQAFCYRGIEDIIIRDSLDVPILTLEGDKPGKIDARTKLRIEAFLDVIGG